MKNKRIKILLISSFTLIIIIMILLLSNGKEVVKPTYSASTIGDIDGSGKVDLTDVARLYRGMKGIIALNDYERKVGDVVQDGTIDLSDIARLYRHYKGIIKDSFIGTNADSYYFLNKSKEIWKLMVSGDRNFKYQEVNNNPIQIPITGSGCNCSAYVSWVLYEYGYKDFKGDQVRTREFYTTDWNKKYGWTEIKFKSGANITSMIKPGDIVVRVQIYSNGSVGYGHMNIVASNGGTYSYDCGNSSYVKNGTHLSGVQGVSWYKKGYPGKIIRPTIKK